MPKNTEQNVQRNTAKNAPEDHDDHGTSFKRVPGPGPKDAGKGAAGADAIDRLEGGLERATDPVDRKGEDDSADEK
jgi:hypothetical protein